MRSSIITALVSAALGFGGGYLVLAKDRVRVGKLKDFTEAQCPKFASQSSGSGSAEHSLSAIGDFNAAAYEAGLKETEKQVAFNTCLTY